MDDSWHLGFHSPLAPRYKQNQAMFTNTSSNNPIYTVYKIAGLQ